MYNMSDYRKALKERGSYDVGSAKWNLEQMKVAAIVSAMVSMKDERMVAEVVDEVYSLNDCGMELDSNPVQFDLWLLESNGYKKEARELRELDWR